MNKEKETYSALGEVGDFQQKRTRWDRIRLDLQKSPLTARFGLVVIFLYIIIALFAPFIAPYGEAEVFPIPYAPWSSEFLFGTDQIGRDIFSRIFCRLYFDFVSFLIVANISITRKCRC